MTWSTRALLLAAVMSWGGLMLVGVSCRGQGDGDGDADGDVDGDGDSDVDVDGDGDADSDTDGDVEPGTCEELPLASGILRNSVSDIDFSEESVVASIEHKLDIDPEEDGCIAKASFTIRKAGAGCEFFISFDVPEAGAPFAITDARLAADSFCPGWSDSDEGVYRFAAGEPTLRMPERVPDSTAEVSCVGNGTAWFGGSMTLSDGTRTIQMNLDDFRIIGDFRSSGNTDLVCPCPPPCGGGDGDADVDADGDSDADSDDACHDEASCRELAGEMFTMMNADRMGAGCGAFLWDNRIATAAQECADTMAEVGSVDSCSSVDTRLRDQGISAFAGAAENQVMNSSMTAAQESILADEPRSTLLYNCNYVIAGVGIAVGADGRTMWFCQTYLDP